MDLLLWGLRGNSLLLIISLDMVEVLWFLTGSGELDDGKLGWCLLVQGEFMRIHRSLDPLYIQQGPFSPTRQSIYPEWTSRGHSGTGEIT